MVKEETSSRVATRSPSGAPEPDPVGASRDALIFGRLVERARSEAAGEALGLYGPGSVTWAIDRELLLGFGGGRALLLQLAHPSVAAGVAGHSAYDTDPLGRSRRTFEAVYRVVFGDLDTAVTVAGRVFGRHRLVRGDGRSDGRGAEEAGRPYRALDPELLLWVYATLIDASLYMYELLVRPPSPAERESYYQESKRAALLYGIPPGYMPPSYSAFSSYFEGMISGKRLQITPDARRVADALYHQPPSAFLIGFIGARGATTRLLHVLDLPPLRRLVDRAFTLLTAGTLPDRFREPFGFHWSDADRRDYTRLVHLLRATFSRLPQSLRYSPTYHEALRRCRARAR